MPSHQTSTGRKVTAIVAGAGSGKRMRSATVKTFLAVAGLPVVVHTLRAIAACHEVTDLVLVVREEDESLLSEYIKRHGILRVSRIVPGGRERQDSVYNAMKTLESDTDVVVVHDAVRPFAPPELFRQVIDAALSGTAAIAAVPLKDTIKTVGKDGWVHSTPERTSLMAVQTPQAFPYAVLRDAYEQAMKEGFYSTDDSALVEHIGQPVRVIQGSYENIKITTPEDLILAEYILRHGKPSTPEEGS